MSAPAFTPAPWEWLWDDDLSSWTLSPGILISDERDGTPGGDNIDQANAHLIAAAPDLYEALELLWDQLGAMGAGQTPHARKAEAVLAKARGES